MNKFDQFPKSMKKLLRYINQDASIDQLEQFKRVLDYAIKKRIVMLKKSSQN